LVCESSRDESCYVLFSRVEVICKQDSISFLLEEMENKGAHL
jgi:hypothetical protein